MNFIRHTLAAAAFAAAAVSPAHAVLFVGSSAPAGSEVRDFSAAGLAAADFDLGTMGVPVSATFQVEASDLGAPIVFNSVVANLTGFLLGELQIAVQGATFASLGSAQRQFTAGVTSLTPATAPASSVLVTVPGGEGLGLVLGNVPGVAAAGAIDWTFDTVGLAAGDTFTVTMTAAIPEPGEWALMLAGLGLVAGVAARRRRAAPALA